MAARLVRDWRPTVVRESKEVVARRCIALARRRLLSSPPGWRQQAGRAAVANDGGRRPGRECAGPASELLLVASRPCRRRWRCHGRAWSAIACARPGSPPGHDSLGTPEGLRSRAGSAPRCCTSSKKGVCLSTVARTRPARPPFGAQRHGYAGVCSIWSMWWLAETGVAAGKTLTSSPSIRPQSHKRLRSAQRGKGIDDLRLR